MRVSAVMLLGGAALASYGLLRGLMSRQGKGRVYVSRGALRGPQGSVRLTDGDMLWLARALVGETGGHDERGMAAVTWALAQNHMLIARRTLPSSFTALVRAYCQPVNPAWANPSTAKCLAHPEACTAAKIARRRRIRSLTWDQIPREAKIVVAKFRRGTLSNPVPGATDFAAYHFRGATVNIGGNWFGVGAARTLV